MLEKLQINKTKRLRIKLITKTEMEFLMDRGISIFLISCAATILYNNNCKNQIIPIEDVQKAENDITRRNHVSSDSAFVAVNFHITRQCNYSCGFCFHTAKTSHVESLENCKLILNELRKAGFQKINFAGGEPFLQAKLLGKLVEYSKLECKFSSVSIISNGSKITEEWFKSYSQFLDILGVSCDSIDEEINQKIGRGKGNHILHVTRAAELCEKYNVIFKINTVVNRYNAHTKMTDFINQLHLQRWKIFQVLPLEGENIGEEAKRDVTPFLISNDEFEDFIIRNRDGLNHPDIMKVENNDVMQSSYFLVDEFGRFLDSSTGGKVPTQSILKVGAKAALQELLSSSGGGFDAQAFTERDGDYRTSSWSKSNCSNCPSSSIQDVPDIEDF